jgi:hypothetical protein
LSIAKLIGTAVRLIEQTSPGVTIEEPGLSPKGIGRQIETAPEGGILSKDESVRLRALMHGLYQEARNKTAGRRLCARRLDEHQRPSDCAWDQPH